MRKSALIGALMAAASAGVGMPGIAIRAGGNAFRGFAPRKSTASIASTGRGFGRYYGKHTNANANARRRLQIERGQLTASNGLVTGTI